MTDEHMMIHRLLELAKDMDGLPPNERRPIELSLGDVSMLSKGVELLAAVRADDLCRAAAVDQSDAEHLASVIRDGQATVYMDMIREMDDVVHALGIEDSFEKPSDRIKRLIRDSIE